MPRPLLVRGCWSIRRTHEATTGIIERRALVGHHEEVTMRRVLALIATAVLIAACGARSGGGGVDAPDPTDAPTPAPTPHAWKVEVVDANYTKTVRVGDDITVNVKIKNTGKAKSLGVRLQFSDLDDYADFNECKPD